MYIVLAASTERKPQVGRFAEEVGCISDLRVRYSMEYYFSSILSHMYCHFLQSARGILTLATSLKNAKVKSFEVVEYLVLIDNHLHHERAASRSWVVIKHNINHKLETTVASRSCNSEETRGASTRTRSWEKRFCWLVRTVSYKSTEIKTCTHT